MFSPWSIKACCKIYVFDISIFKKTNISLKLYALILKHYLKYFQKFENNLFDLLNFFRLGDDVPIKKLLFSSLAGLSKIHRLKRKLGTNLFKYKCHMKLQKVY